MEGRTPPPNASEFKSYINIPLDTRKFWGTPIAKGFWKFFFAITGAMITINGTNCYLTRNQTHVLGYKISYTSDEVKQQKDLAERRAFISGFSGIQIDYASRGIIKQDDKVDDIRLDDRIEHLAGVSKHSISLTDP